MRTRASPTLRTTDYSVIVANRTRDTIPFLDPSRQRTKARAQGRISQPLATRQERFVAIGTLPFAKVAVRQRLTTACPLVRMPMMIHRVASALLVVALVSAGGSAPFAHAPRPNPRQRAMRARCARSIDTAQCVHRQDRTPGPTTLVADRHHHLSVALATVSVSRPSVRVGATPALVGFVMAGIVPDLPVQPVPAAANTRPSRHPRIVLAARAPPV